MKALTLIPLKAGSAELSDIAEPPLARWQEALNRKPDDVKVIIEVNPA